MSAFSKLELVITKQIEAYAIEVRSSTTVGEIPPQTFKLPFEIKNLPKQRREIRRWIEDANEVRRSGGNPDLTEARKFGSMLFESLFIGEILGALRASRTNLKPSSHLRLNLHLPPDLVGLPWELIHDPLHDEFLAIASDLTFVRYTDTPRPFRPLRVEGPLQVLVVLASPLDAHKLDIERERNNVERVLQPFKESKVVNLDVITGPDTLNQLRARLRRPVHVLHIVCHGEIDDVYGKGVLLFEDNERKTDPVSATQLGLYLEKQSSSLCLVLLNACKGAVHVDSDPFSSVAASLVRDGIPAVVAMQFDIRDKVAIRLSDIFYNELLAGTPVDQILTEIRRDLLGKFNESLDWAIPVLFLRTEDAVIFDPTSIEAEVNLLEPQNYPPISSNDERLLEAQICMLNEEWAEAQIIYEELVKQYSLSRYDREQLELARANAFVKSALTEITNAEKQFNWQGAIALLEHYLHSVPNDEDAKRRLKTAREENVLDALCRKSEGQANKGEWENANALLSALEKHRTNYTHSTINLTELRHRVTTGLLTTQSKELAQKGAWKQLIKLLEENVKGLKDAYLESLLNHARMRYAYQQAVTQFEHKKWESVIRILESIPATILDSDSQTLLKQAHTEIEDQKRRTAEEKTQRIAEEIERTYRKRFGPILEHFQANRYAQGFNLLSNILNTSPNDPEALALILEKITDTKVPIQQRLYAAVLINTFKDPRPGIYQLPQSSDDFYWCNLFSAGNYSLSKSNIRTHLKGFRIARYPVTVSQFRYFIKEEGYSTQKWWTPSGWNFINTIETSLLIEKYDSLPDNQPICGVSWYEAVAFCNWLTERSRKAGWLHHHQVIRLPTEAEWIVAAMWDTNRKQIVRWKSQTGELRQNVREAGIKRPSPVGIFPQGMSPSGAIDMAGNVWEWCSSSNVGGLEQSYIIQTDINTSDAVLRGGSFLQNDQRSGWDSRLTSYPETQLNDRGFRIALAQC
jgi:formylglycine-generating enzyme required for sulfatase activity